MSSFKDRDVSFGALLLALVAAPLLPSWISGLVHYWGDLTYLQHPWHVYDAQLLEAGRLPLWNPYVYFGMPQAAAMQDALFYPGGALFSFFSFPVAAEAFAAAHAALAGWLTFLWLRALRLRPSAALLGAAAVSLGGIFLENRQFINHLSTLAFVPALLLCFGRPLPLALALALAFLAGFPPFLVGGAAAAWGLALALGGRAAKPALRAWVAAGALAALASACLLLPALELWSRSRRAAGVPLEEALLRRFAPADLLQWLGPLATGFARFDPSRRWWTCCCVGLVVAASALAGVRRLSAYRRAGLILLIGGAAALTLGPRWAWARLAPLRFMRYPGNLSFLALWPVALCAALGAGRRWSRLLAAAAAVELLFYSWNALPVFSARMYSERGPLVERLQNELDGERFMLSPRALEAGQGRDPVEWKERLYGLNSAAYRLRAASDSGEPLVPASNFAAMDALFSAKDAAAAAALLPAADVRILLTPSPLLAAPGLEPAGRALWSFSRATAPAAPALFFDERAPLADALAPLPPGGRPLALERPREDRFAVEGEATAPGWAYVAEPLYPGWKVRFDDGAAARPLPAMTAFQKIAVPAGRWRLTFRYDPESWRAGLLATLAGLALLSALAHRRLSRWQNSLRTS